AARAGGAAGARRPPGPPPRAAAPPPPPPGRWRGETFLDDLYRTAARAPQRPAIVSERAHRPAGRRLVTVTYAQLAAYVNRFAAALSSLGVVAGDPVAYQLPNWWETTALTLACLRVGAVAVPVLPTVRARGLHRILDGTRARICVVPDVWEGFAHAEALADLAGRLPWLRHRVVVGDAAATGAVDFTAYFRRTAHERTAAGLRSGPRGGRADRPALLISVMGLRDSYTSVLHSPNTLYANISAQSAPDGPGRRPGEAFLSTLPLTSLASLIYTVCWPLAVGGTGVFQDVWDPGRCLDLMAAAGVDQVYAEPAYLAELVTAQRRRPRAARRLRLVLSGGRTSTPAPLAEELREVFGVPVLSVWGAPELGMGALSGSGGGDRDGDGVRPLGGLEVSAAHAGSALEVRGPSVCLATWRHGAPAPVATWEHGDGWLDTGDLAAADRDGGIRVLARAGTRTGAIFMVPVSEVEERLLAHPRVREAAVVAYTDPEHGELPCAVVVPAAAVGPPGRAARARGPAPCSSRWAAPHPARTRAGSAARRPARPRSWTRRSPRPWPWSTPPACRPPRRSATSESSSRRPRPRTSSPPRRPSSALTSKPCSPRPATPEPGYRRPRRPRRPAPVPLRPRRAAPDPAPPALEPRGPGREPRRTVKGRGRCGAGRGRRRPPARPLAGAPLRQRPASAAPRPSSPPLPYRPSSHSPPTST
ncbi:AMP-binding protein, partial [Streptomyces erythrochromogenes]|uniref:AMP-binding protein n=1 Tax=Streptomyces erythrochromogenes TaxID=285574 RepID=UPI0036D14C03